MKVSDSSTEFHRKNFFYHEEMEYNPSAKEKCYGFFYVFILIAYSIIMMALSATAFKIIPCTSPYLQEVINNWNTNVITDITVNATCPTNYTPIYNYSYPGMSIGCNCLNANGTGIYIGISKHNCTSTEISAGCTLVNPLNSIAFTQFSPNSSFIDNVNNSGSSICILRSQGINWNTRAVESPYQCPVGTIPCGNSSNFATRICVESSIGNCPINNLTTTMISMGDATNCQSTGTCIITKTFSNFTAQVLQWGRTANSLPIVEFKLNEYIMCDLSSQNDISPNRTLYPLYNSSNLQTCTPVTDFNTSWQPLLTLTEISLFSYNGIINNYTQLPNISNYSNQIYNWTVYSRPYFQWDVPCRYYYFHAFINNIDAGSKITLIERLNVILLVITSFLFMIVLPILMIFQLMCTKKNKKVKDIIRTKRLYKIPSYILKALQLVILAIASTQSFYYKNIFSYVIQNNCIQNAPNQVNIEITNLSNSMGNIANLNLIALGLCAAFITLDIIEQIISQIQQRKWIKNSFKSIPEITNLEAKSHLNNTYKQVPLDVDITVFHEKEIEMFDNRNDSVVESFDDSQMNLNNPDKTVFGLE